eukprot:scaffold119489_cov28-Tisochrysis_lutea.AAC.6
MAMALRRTNRKDPVRRSSQGEGGTAEPSSRVALYPRLAHEDQASGASRSRCRCSATKAVHEALRLSCGDSSQNRGRTTAPRSVSSVVSRSPRGSFSTGSESSSYTREDIRKVHVSYIGPHWIPQARGGETPQMQWALSSPGRKHTF